MERLIRLYRVGSSPIALSVLVAVNALPLVGVLLWGWNLWSILILYWLENGMVGLLNVAKMGLAQGWGGAGAAKIVLIPFFLFHYGLFWLVHGVFVLFALPLFANVGAALTSGDPLIARPGPNWNAILWAGLALAISHVASFGLNYIGRREYLTATPIGQMFAPYARVFVLHLTIILGAIVSAALGNPIGALVVLVVLKTAIDVALHLREHAGFGPGAVPQPGATGVA
jgi:hypothetical protein